MFKTISFMIGYLWSQIYKETEQLVNLKNTSKILVSKLFFFLYIQSISGTQTRKEITLKTKEILMKGNNK